MIGMRFLQLLLIVGCKAATLKPPTGVEMGPCVPPANEFSSINMTCNVSIAEVPYKWKFEKDVVATCLGNPPVCTTNDNSYKVFLVNGILILNIIKVTKQSAGKYGCSDLNNRNVVCILKVNARSATNSHDGPGVSVWAVVGGTLAAIIVVMQLF